MQIPSSRPATVAHQSTRAGRLAQFLLAAAFAGIANTPDARAELLVLQPGGGSSFSGSAMVWRFDSASGNAVANFRHENEGFYAMSATSDGSVFVTSNILGYYDLYQFTRTGEYLGTAATATYGDFRGVTRAADGSLFALMRRGDLSSSDLPPAFVAKLDRRGATTFVPNGTDGMLNPIWMVSGPDGDLYLADRARGIMRFDPITGASKGVLVPLGRGGLSTIERMVFGPDNRLYVSTGVGNSVLRYDGATGSFIDTFVAAQSGGLNGAHGLAFGPDGHLYVASRGTHQVLLYDGSTGAFMTVVVSEARLRFPTDIAFTADASKDSVRFDGAAPAGAVPSGI